jgi:CubicO group peptidase (beta-lactamase class C family)
MGSTFFQKTEPNMHASHPQTFRPLGTRNSGRFWVVSALALLLSAGSASAAESGSQALAAISARMQQFVDQGQIAGAVTVVGRHDRILSCEAVGLRDVEAREPMTGDALFRIASMTKPITAIGIMILAEQRKLSVDDPVERYLPEFRGQMLGQHDHGSLVLKPPARKITIRDLLTHTSGVPSGLPPDMADLYRKRDRTLAEVIPTIAKRPLEFEPGSRWAYCNLGIDTLGRIIEVVSGQPYERFLQQRIFAPLGMADTTFYPSAGQRRRLATLYDSRQGKLVGVGYQLLGSPANARYPIPAGGLYSTGADLARLYRMMLCGGQFQGARILTEQGVREMTRVQTGELAAGFVPGMGFGLGWAVVRQPQGITEMLSPGTFGHGGAFGTQAWIDPRQDLFVILLIQRVGLKNADGSEMRRELQRLAVTGVGGKG